MKRTPITRSRPWKRTILVFTGVVGKRHLLGPALPQVTEKKMQGPAQQLTQLQNQVVALTCLTGCSSARRQTESRWHGKSDGYYSDTYLIPRPSRQSGWIRRPTPNPSSHEVDGCVQRVCPQVSILRTREQKASKN